MSREIEDSPIYINLKLIYYISLEYKFGENPRVMRAAFISTFMTYFYLVDTIWLVRRNRACLYSKWFHLTSCLSYAFPIHTARFVRCGKSDMKNDIVLIVQMGLNTSRLYGQISGTGDTHTCCSALSSIHITTYCND